MNIELYAYKLKLQILCASECSGRGGTVKDKQGACSYAEKTQTTESSQGPMPQSTDSRNRQINLTVATMENTELDTSIAMEDVT